MERPFVFPVRSVVLVTVLTALGTFFGYAREAGLAAVFGASNETDAFFVATIIPIMLGRVILSGALAPAILPVFTSWLSDRRGAWRMANTLITIAFFLLPLITLALAVYATPVVNLISPGLDSGRASLAIRLLVISAPAVVFFGLSALLGALLNALDVYHVPALGTALVNGISFAAVITSAYVGGIESVAASLVVGGLVQFAAQIIALRRAGWRYEIAFAWTHPAVREIGRLFIPLLAFMLVDQTVTLTERIIGSNFPSGDLSRLTYANKLFQIPNLVITGSFVVVLFPALARHANDNLANYEEVLLGGLRAIAILTIPFALWLGLANSTVVRLIFQRGEFTATDTLLTADLLRGYALAVVPTAWLLVLTRGFHARRDTLTPLVLSLITASVYVACAINLAGQFQIAGLPLAFGLAQVFGVVLSFLTLSLKIRLRAVRRTGADLMRVLAASAALLIGAFGWLTLIEPALAETSVLVQASAFVLTCALSGLAYLAAANALGVREAKAYLRLAGVRGFGSRAGL